MRRREARRVWKTRTDVRDKGEMGEINRAASATDLMAAFGDSIICHCLIFDPDMIIFNIAESIGRATDV